MREIEIGLVSHSFAQMNACSFQLIRKALSLGGTQDQFSVLPKFPTQLECVLALGRSRLQFLRQAEKTALSFSPSFEFFPKFFPKGHCYHYAYTSDGDFRIQRPERDSFLEEGVYLQGLHAVWAIITSLGLEGVQFERWDKVGNVPRQKQEYGNPLLTFIANAEGLRKIHPSFHTQALPSPPASTSESLKQAWKAVFCLLSLSSSSFPELPAARPLA